MGVLRRAIAGWPGPVRPFKGRAARQWTSAAFASRAPQRSQGFYGATSLRERRAPNRH